MTKTTKFNGSAEKPPTVFDCKDADMHDLLFEAGAKGPLLKAMEKGECVVLRNLDKAKPGTADGALQQIITLYTGEVQEITLYPGQKTQPIHFKKEDIGGFRLQATVTDKNLIAPSVQTRLGRDLIFEKGVPFVDFPKLRP